MSGGMMVPDNRLPLTTTGLANLLNVVSTNQSLEIYRRSQRIAAGAERISNDVDTLTRELAELRGSLRSGDFGDLLVMPEPESAPDPAKITFTVGARPFAPGRS